MVGRRCLAGEKKRPRRELLTRVLPQPVVKHDDSQRIEQLPFVLVDALNLAVKNCVRIHCYSGLRSNPSSKSGFRLASGRAKAVAKAYVSSERLQFAQLAEIREPAFADCLGNCTSQGWI